MAFRLLRSNLFIPGSNRRALVKTLESYKVANKSINSLADTIIIDWEDAVGPSSKESCRTSTIDVLKSVTMQGNENFPRLIIRINCPKTSIWGNDDMLFIKENLNNVKIDGISIPKVESVDVINHVLEKIEDTNIKIWPMLETPLGILNSSSIAAVAQVEALVLGSNDLSKSLRCNLNAKRREPLLFSMSQLILAARVHGKYAIDGVYMQIKKTGGVDDDKISEGLAEVCHQGKDLGFDGKSLIHPTQIVSTNNIFGPSVNDYNSAKIISEEYSKAVAAGKGVCVVDGKLIEQLHVFTQSPTHAFIHIHSLTHVGRSSASNDSNL